MRVSKLLVLVLCVCLAVSMFQVQDVHAGKATVNNGGFESGDLRGWSRNYGSGGDVVVTSEKSYTGDYSMKIVDTRTDTNFGASSDKIGAKPGELYRAKVKTFVEQGKASLYLRFYNSANTRIGSYLVKLESPMEQWTDHIIEAEAPEGTVALNVALYSDSRTASIVYYDDLSIDGAFFSFGQGDLLLSNHSFESNGWSGWTEVGDTDAQLSIQSDRTVDGEYALQVDKAGDSDGAAILSSPVPVRESETYYAIAHAFIEKGMARLAIQFRDAGGQVVGESAAQFAAPKAQWFPISVEGKAPDGAVSAAVKLYTDSTDQAVRVLYDNVLFTEKVTNLGTQVTNTVARDGAMGYDENGRPVYYTVSNAGGPVLAKLLVIDVNSGELLKEMEISGAKESWAMVVASDQRLYMGTNDGGKLLRYTPGDVAVEDLGRAVAGQSHIWSMAKGNDGEVFGGTYNGAYVFRYGDDGFQAIGPNGIGERFDNQESYVRGLGYDRENEVIYAGIGTHPKLTRFNLNTGQADQLLPPGFDGDTTVYNVDVEGGKVFARLSSSGTMLVLDVQEDSVTHEVTSTIDQIIYETTSQGVSPEYNGKVYLTVNTVMHEYDIATKTLRSLDVNFGISPRGMDFVTLDNQAEFPGATLVGSAVLNGDISLLKYNLQTGAYTVESIERDGTPTIIRTLQAGPDGHIYGSALSMGEYTPMRSDLSLVNRGIGQAQGQGVVGDKHYFGVYPGANIYEYDPSEPWVAGENPRQLFSLKTFQDSYQDRPVAMAGGEGKLFIGTVPDYGRLEGAFTVYDTLAGGDPVVHRNMIQEQSIITLTYKDGFVYGGSSIWGGLGIEPTQSEAKLFIYDVDSGQKVKEMVPVPGKKAISYVMVGPDGNIWGLAEGTLFILDAVTHEVTYTSTLFPEVDYTGYGHMWVDAVMAIGNDGDVYGVINYKLFKLDVDTMTVDILTMGNAGPRYMTIDAYGHLYYAIGTDMYRYVTGTVPVPEQLDQEAPVTLTDAPQDWVNEDVTVTMSVYDDLSGPAHTHYSIDGGAFTEGTSFTLSTEGEHTIQYYSVDLAGNQEEVKSTVIKIDKTAPQLSLSLSQDQLGPVNHKMVPITVSWDVTDEGAGIKEVTLISVTSNEPDDGLGDGHSESDIQGAELGTSDTEISLRAERSGTGEGRVYSLVYEAIDFAGNTVRDEATVSVPKNP